jgi:hypothetical protein
MLPSRQKRPGVRERTRITGKYSGRKENDGPVRNNDPGGKKVSTFKIAVGLRSNRYAVTRVTANPRVVKYRVVLCKV